MTIYAQSGHVAVIVSADGHGGCGRTHTRPVDHGKPATIWALTCPPCENHLRHDPLWAMSPSKIPETHDEAANREEIEKSQARAQQDIMVQSLQVLAGNVNRDAAPQVRCVNGHQNAAMAKFCTECGAPVARQEAVTCADGHESPAGARFCVECGQPTGVLEGSPRVPEAVAEAAFAETAPEPPAGPPPALPASRAPANGAATAMGDGGEPPYDLPARTPPAPPPPAPPQRAPLPSNTKMRGMKRGDLVGLAETAGVDPGGTREQVLNRLITVNNA